MELSRVSLGTNIACAQRKWSPSSSTSVAQPDPTIAEIQDGLEPSAGKYGTSEVEQAPSSLWSMDREVIGMKER